MNFVTDDKNLEIDSVRTKKKALDFGNYSQDWERKRDRERQREDNKKLWKTLNELFGQLNIR